MSIAFSDGDAAIWLRVMIPGEGEMSLEAARYFLNLDFDQSDRDRMHDLAVKNQAGELDDEGLEELRGFQRVAAQFDLLKSQARLVLRKNNLNPQ